jgi:hypothetical protein
MKRKHSFYIVLAILLLSSCIKAYEAPIVEPVKPNIPFSITDLEGLYKGGTIVSVKALLDSVTYRTTDDTSSFSLTNYYNDTVIVSLNTSQGVSYKRYKLGLVDTLQTSEATVFKFQKIMLDPSYYLYNKVFNLEVKLYYPSALKKSTAIISNSSIAAYTPNFIYIENLDISAFLQAK